MNRHQVTVDTQKCIGCGMCTKVCVAHNITTVDKKAQILSDDCLLCGQCTAVCPTKAITVSGYDAGQIVEKENMHLDPDEILNAIRFRRSTRNFKKQEIPKSVIDQILEAGRLTHTAKNTQDVTYIVLDKEKERIEKMAVGLFQKIKPFADLLSPLSKKNTIDSHFFFFQAPLVIVILAKNKTNGILAAQNMEFAAQANGLGVLFSGFFTAAFNTSTKIRRTMKAPKGKKAAITLVLGYPAINFLRSVPRKPLDAIYV
ncbi:MAG: nitroreductase family protein [Oscillospiraceae bacterium]|nr:nitroreductase family protein [Oscillospiraceae bacterium]